MLNCFYWYGYIWLGILILYSFGITVFTEEIDDVLFLFFVTTIMISFILGYIFRKEFVFTYSKKNIINISQSTLYLIILGVVIDFVYAGEIPLISIALSGTSHYKNFEGIPIFHVFLTCMSTYYAIVYFYAAITDLSKRKLYLFYFSLIQCFYLLYFLRSQILFNLFMAGVILFSYLRSINKITLKHIVEFIFSAILVLYLFGGFGNLRSGYSWDDSSYISRLGLYLSWPDYIPEQFKWAYSYITTPLANLNFNVGNVIPSYDLLNFLMLLFPQTISKRVFGGNEGSLVELVKGYFTASSCYSPVYVEFGFLGMLLYFVFLIIITLFGLKLSTKRENINRKSIFCSIMCLINAFLFFTDTLYFAGTSILLWISILNMCFNFKLKLNFSLKSK